MNNERIKRISKIMMILSLTIGLLSLIVLLPAVRNQIILFGEKYVGRPLTHEVWHARFIRWEIEIFVCFIFITNFFAYFYVNSIPKLYKNLQGIFYLRKTVSDIKKSKMHGAELLIILASLIALSVFIFPKRKACMLTKVLVLRFVIEMNLAFGVQIMN